MSEISQLLQRTMPTECFPNFQNFGLFNSGRNLSAHSSRWASDNANRNIENDWSDADNNLWYLSSRSSSVVVLTWQNNENTVSGKKYLQSSVNNLTKTNLNVFTLHYLVLAQLRHHRKWHFHTKVDYCFSKQNNKNAFNCSSHWWQWGN